MLFISTDHLNRARPVLSNDATAMLKLNIEAATRAMSKRAFISAITYLESGLDWMGGRNWNSKYEATLSIMHKLAVAYSCLGNVDQCKGGCGFDTGARALHSDKMPTYFTLMDFLATQNESQQVIDLCLTVLNEIGGESTAKDNQNSSYI
jgi:hypothetical protein